MNRYLLNIGHSGGTEINLLEHFIGLLEKVEKILAHREALLENPEPLFEQLPTILEDQAFIGKSRNILEHAARLLENPRQAHSKNKIQTIQTVLSGCLTFIKCVDLLNNPAYTDNSELQNLTRARRQPQQINSN